MPPKSKHEADLVLKGEIELDTKKVFDLIDPDIWRCNKCGAEVQSEETPVNCEACKRSSSFKRITWRINADLWELPKWQDIPIGDIDMLNTYNDTINLLKRTIIFMEDIQYKIYALWNISTWKIEYWNYVGTPFFKGLVDSGKTKGLDIIRKLGWRAIQSTSMSFPAMVRATHYHNATVLLDEVEHKLSHNTERGQDMIDFIKPGYRVGSKYCVADKEDPTKIISYRNFGFKAFAGEILRDRGMLSRCIPFDMEKDYPEVEDLAEVQDEFDRIKTTLLNYKYKMNGMPKWPEDCSLRGRIREIYESIIRTGTHIGLDVSDVIEFAQRHEKEQISEFQNSVEREILEIIYNSETSGTLDVDDAPELIKLRDIRDKLGWDDAKSLQKLGYILRGKGMGLHTFHTRDGAVLKYVDEKTKRKLGYLYKRYGVLPSE